MTPSGRRTGEAGWTVMEVLLVVAMLGLFLALAVPHAFAARIRNNEAAAARALRAIAAAQAIIRDAGLVDTDGDGRGEHAFLQELAGERVPRSGRALTASNGTGARHRGPPGPLPQFYLRFTDDGEARITGYAYRVFLPGSGGVGVAETREGASLATTAPVDPHLAADTWCAYAWPVDRAGEWWIPPSGAAAFFVNQAGILLRAPGSPYGSTARTGFDPRRPEAGAAFVPPGAADRITGAAACDAAGRDGLTWRILR